MVRYEPNIDLDAISAIDMHVHVEQDRHGRVTLDDDLLAASKQYFKNHENPLPTVSSLAERYRRAGMAAVVFTVDATTVSGRTALSSSEIAEECADHADVLIPFGSVDPHLGPQAVERAHELVEDHGVRGFKFHPSVQAFEPNDERYYPLWSAIERLGVPALFHSGQNGIGAGMPGGRGIKLRYSNPILLDDVAADYPRLTVILAHPSVPWQDEAISMAVHKSNLFLELSGWSPKRFPPQLVTAAKKHLSNKVVFGSGYPMIDPDQWMADFATLGVPEDRVEAIIKGTAAKILALEGA
jgi:uncharacterized protein